MTPTVTVVVGVGDFFVVPIGTDDGTEALGLAIDVKDRAFSSILTIVEGLKIEVIVANFILVPFTYA